MNKFKEEIVKHLQTILCNGVGIGASISYLDQVKDDPEVQKDAQLHHFLERRSYQKAWNYLIEEAKK